MCRDEWNINSNLYYARFLSIEVFSVSYMRVNKEHAVVIAVVVGAFLICFLYVYWLTHGLVILVNPAPPEVIVQEVDWKIPFARAELNLCYHGYGKLFIEHVEVNGTKVDAYPENLSMECDDSAFVRVYFPYDYSVGYEFKIVTKWRGQTFNFTSVWLSPLPPV